MTELIAVEKIENKIFQIRGKKVMLDSDLSVDHDLSGGTL